MARGTVVAQLNGYRVAWRKPVGQAVVPNALERMRMRPVQEAASFATAHGGLEDGRGSSHLEALDALPRTHREH